MSQDRSALIGCAVVAGLVVLALLFTGALLILIPIWIDGP
jgi:hypothetical protein